MTDYLETDRRPAPAAAASGRRGGAGGGRGAAQPPRRQPMIDVALAMQPDSADTDEEEEEEEEEENGSTETRGGGGGAISSQSSSGLGSPAMLPSPAHSSAPSDVDDGEEAWLKQIRPFTPLVGERAYGMLPCRCHTCACLTVAWSSARGLLRCV